MYHLIIDAFVTQVLNRSKQRPIRRIVNIWFRTDSNDAIAINAVVIAMIEVIVIVVPVLNALKREVLIPSFLFRSLVVRSMSVSTE